MGAFNGEVAIVIAQMLFGRHVAAYPAGRAHRAVSFHQNQQAASGNQWLHEIKHDGFRVIARKNGVQVKLYSRPGNDLTYRFSLIGETYAACAAAPASSTEAVACDDNGVTSFNRVRYRRHDESIFLYAFDLIELNGDDLRSDPLEGRKGTLEIILV